MDTEISKILIANANPSALPQGIENDPRVILVRKGKLPQLTAVDPNVDRMVVYKPEGGELDHLRKLNNRAVPVQQALRTDTVMRTLSNFLGVANDPGSDEDSDQSLHTQKGKRGPRANNPTRDFIRENLWRVEGKGLMEACRILHELGTSQGLQAKLGSYPAYVKALREEPQQVSGVVTTGGESAVQAGKELEGLRGMLTSFHTQVARLEKQIQLLAAENDALRLGNQTLQSRAQAAEAEKTEMARTIADQSERLRTIAGQAERLQKLTSGH